MRKSGIFIAIAVSAWILAYAELDGSPSTVRMAAIAASMSVLWVTEAIPLAATSLFPLVLFPLLGISSTSVVAAKYMNSTVFLLIGGFMIALAMERWNLHKRIALNVISLFGDHPRRLMMGFMAATAFLSMWISNTATTLVMLPIALAIISQFEPELGDGQCRRVAIGLLLAIAYSASIGGMMTLVGTAPNLVFARIYEISNEGAAPIGFAQWMFLAIPVGVLMLTTTGIVISLLYFRRINASGAVGATVSTEKKKLGAIRFEEKAVLLLFILTASLWTTRKGIRLGDFTIPGWQSFFDTNNLMDDGTIAVGMALVLFFVPARDTQGRRTTILDEGVFKRLPWNVVVLFGGGFALASGFVESGLSGYLASQLNALDRPSLLQTLFAVSSTMTLLTELTSNTATTQLVLPILQSVAEGLSISPLWLMLPATLSASCAFMFPVATPPNAIVFGSGRLHVMDMVKTGVLLNLSGILVVISVVWLLAPWVFGISAGSDP